MATVIVREDADDVAADSREAGHEGGAVGLLELVKAGAINDPRNDLAHIVRLPNVSRNDAADLRRIVARRLGRA